MVDRANIPDDVRRFILTSIPSVPYLEAMLLLRENSAQAWEGASVARRLYMPEAAADKLLEELHAAKILSAASASPTTYRYAPASDELREMIAQLAVIYSRHLVEVTNLIHSNTGKKAQQFADAFKWRKDS